MMARGRARYFPFGSSMVSITVSKEHVKPMSLRGNNPPQTGGQILVFFALPMACLSTVARHSDPMSLPLRAGRMTGLCDASATSNHAPTQGAMLAARRGGNHGLVRTQWVRFVHSTWHVWHGDADPHI